MTLDDLRKYYRTSYEFRRQTGMSHANWKNWRKMGYIPIATQIKIEKLTGGQFKANLNDIKE